MQIIDRVSAHENLCIFLLDFLSVLQHYVHYYVFYFKVPL